jgi:hypothetical protein
VQFPKFFTEFIIIIIIITFMQRIYNEVSMPEIKHVSKVYAVAAIL